MTYRERKERRAERLRLWAEQREVKADQAFSAAKEQASQIPFGQPIIIGHHSEKRSRRTAEKIRRGFDASVEHQNKADGMKQRAEGIQAQLERSIYDDDPNAIEQLQERIAQLEAQREGIKAYNASCRKGSPNLDLLVGKYRRDAETMDKRWLGAKGELPGFALSNLGGNIRRNQQRLARLQRKQAV